MKWRKWGAPFGLIASVMLSGLGACNQSTSAAGSGFGAANPVNDLLHCQPWAPGFRMVAQWIVQCHGEVAPFPVGCVRTAYPTFCWSDCNSAWLDPMEMAACANSAHQRAKLEVLVDGESFVVPPLCRQYPGITSWNGVEIFPDALGKYLHKPPKTSELTWEDFPDLFAWESKKGEPLPFQDYVGWVKFGHMLERGTPPRFPTQTDDTASCVLCSMSSCPGAISACGGDDQCSCMENCLATSGDFNWPKCLSQCPCTTGCMSTPFSSTGGVDPALNAVVQCAIGPCAPQCGVPPDDQQSGTPYDQGGTPGDTLYTDTGSSCTDNYGAGGGTSSSTSSSGGCTPGTGMAGDACVSNSNCVSCSCYMGTCY